MLSVLKMNDIFCISSLACSIYINNYNLVLAKPVSISLALY